MDQTRHSGRLMSLAFAALCVGGGLLVAFLYVRFQTPTRHQPALSPQEPAPLPQECTRIDAPCLRFGYTGECIQNRCVLGGGLCSQDVDCDDEDPCTIDRCHAGTCEQPPREGVCTRGDSEPGKCLDGVCDVVASTPAACTTDADCPQSNHPCHVFRCANSSCIRRQRQEGESCQVASGRAGVCSQGSCVFGMEQAERCKTVWDPYWGAQRLCSKTVAFTMEPAEIASAEQKIAKDLQTELRYEMKVALVALPDGGYNVVTLNRRPRTDLHGMCDPSYVAWNVAFFTASSKWKSRLLQIWTKPYDEGWYLSTSGSRSAMRQGRAGSALGWLGVVHVPTFRKWLDKSFRPLPSVTVTATPAYKSPVVATYETVPLAEMGGRAQPDSGLPVTAKLKEPQQDAAPTQPTSTTIASAPQATQKLDTHEGSAAAGRPTAQPTSLRVVQRNPLPPTVGAGSGVAAAPTEESTPSKRMGADKEPTSTEPRPARKQRAAKEKKTDDDDENYLFKPAPKKGIWTDPFAE